MPNSQEDILLHFRIYFVVWHILHMHKSLAFVMLILITQRVLYRKLWDPENKYVQLQSMQISNALFQLSKTFHSKNITKEAQPLQHHQVENHLPLCSHIIYLGRYYLNWYSWRRFWWPGWWRDMNRHILGPRSMAAMWHPLQTPVARYVGT